MISFKEIESYIIKDNIIISKENKEIKFITISDHLFRKSVHFENICMNTEYLKHNFYTKNELRIQKLKILCQK